MKYKFFTILAMVLLVMASCTRQRRHHRGSLLTPSSSGNPYEVMVVAEDSVWNGYVGSSIQRILDTPLKGLPQDEEMFHTSHIVHRHYDKITNLFRNIILINIGKEYAVPKIRVEHDVHSTPQGILKITGPNQREVSMYVTENTKNIQNFFTDEEINRQALDLTDWHNKKFNEKVKEMFGCELYIPTDIKKMKIGENFIWASNDAVTGIQNIVIYSLPYVSEKMFLKRPYCALRDTIMKANIPGDKPGMYMSTNRDYVWTKNFSIKGDFVMEARGLWEMHNDAMGGPFVSHSRIDTVNNKVITVEGFVYAPEKMKRTMIRRLEAALYTLKLPAPEDKDKKDENKK
ncbi:MAG: DUF4837 family protein [Bacteroidaceae bacterium]|nr:DUF4837 family protein [Bacteroidaceae bacterium]